MTPLTLIIERAQGTLWGRIHYDDDLIVDSARTLDSLEKKMKKLLKDLHQADTKNIVFDYQYDLTALFEKFSYLKISAIAEKSDMNAALLRQYVTGAKHPSPKQAKKVEDAIHKIGKELSDIAVYVG
jgi:hypothetical protein